MSRKAKQTPSAGWRERHTQHNINLEINSPALAAVGVCWDIYATEIEIYICSLLCKRSSSPMESENRQRTTLPPFLLLPHSWALRVVFKDEKWRGDWKCESEGWVKVKKILSISWIRAFYKHKIYAAVIWVVCEFCRLSTKECASEGMSWRYLARWRHTCENSSWGSLIFISILYPLFVVLLKLCLIFGITTRVMLLIHFQRPQKKFFNGKRGTQLCRLAQRALCGVVAVQQRMKYAINSNEICVVKIHDKLDRFASHSEHLLDRLFFAGTRERERVRKKNIIYLLIKHFVKYKRYQLLTNTNCVELELENAELACCFMACWGGRNEWSFSHPSWRRSFISSS